MVKQPEGPADDLTARARIRDAAMDLFAVRGVKGTTIRGVAEAAGVSPGLVQHHFGSKEALRKACDAYAVEAMKSLKAQAINDGAMGQPGFLGMAVQISTRLQRYVARSMVDGSETAAALFDELVDYTETALSTGELRGVNRPTTDDLHAYAATMVTMHLGVMVLRDHLSRSLGVDVLSPEGYPRLTMAILDIYTDTLIDPELVAAIRAATRPESFHRPPNADTPAPRLPEPAPRPEPGPAPEPPGRETPGTGSHTSSHADKESDDD